jgi:hypothetical protein
LKLANLMFVFCVAALVMAKDANGEENVDATAKLPLYDKAKLQVYNAEPGLVTTIISYEEFGGGDVVFILDKPTVGCAGYWLKTSDPGFKSNLSILLMARSSKVPLFATGYDERIWPGSTGARYCHLYALQIQ